jgi:diketogulonate reductase-like aldo/keto reductase
MKIPKIGQGTGHKGENADVFYQDLESNVFNVRFAVDNGLDLIDTAEIYCEGRSEKIIGLAIKNIRNQVKIASKFSPNNHRRKDINKSIEGSLDRLGTDYLDLYQIHWPNEKVPLEETLTAMFDLQRKGVILEVGLCNFSRSQLSRAISIASECNSRIFSVQIKFNLNDQFAYRQIETICTENKINIIAYSPLRNLLGQQNKRIESLERIASELGKTPAQIALKWVVSHKGVSTIPESSKLDRILEFASVGQFELDEKHLLLLSSVFENIVEDLDVAKISSRNVARAGSVNDLSQKEIQSFSDDFCPSIIDLASEIKTGNFLQPILVRIKPEDSKMYEIVEGELRYWAFVYCFGRDSKIPVTIV